MPTNNPSLHYIDAGDLDPTGDHSNCERFWANIKAQHAHIYGDASAYNFAVCNAHGTIMEGRGWDQSSLANGQQGGVDYNPGSRALVALMGSLDEPTPQLKQAVADWTADAYAHGKVAPLRAHSSFVATSCPGDLLRAVVDQVNAGTFKEDDVISNEQMDEIARWMREQRQVTEKYVDQKFATLKKEIGVGFDVVLAKLESKP